MRRIDGVDFIVIGFLRCRHADTRRIECLLRSIQFALARSSLLHCGGMRIAQIKYILLSELRIETRLLQFAVRDAGTVLSLLEHPGTILYRGRDLCLQQSGYTQQQ